MKIFFERIHSSNAIFKGNFKKSYRSNETGRNLEESWSTESDVMTRQVMQKNTEDIWWDIAEILFCQQPFFKHVRLRKQNRRDHKMFSRVLHRGGAQNMREIRKMY